jgi:protein-disulfide isomerase
MRLTFMSSLPTRRLLAAALALGLAAASVPAHAQRALPAGSGQVFKDTSMIKPPAGAKVAIYEFEDLECPACARAHPMVVAALEHYKIAFVRRDFPLPMHIWSTDAAIWARYLQDKISPKVADEYRTAVFANQGAIASKDDLLAFTRRFFQSKGGQMPFVVDPTGELRKEVFADKALGEKMGLSQTPTLFVCNQQGWIQVTDPTQLYQAIETVEANTPTAPTVKKASR